MKKIKTLNSALFLIFMIAVSITSISIWVYFGEFVKILKTDQNDLGALGDFFGGILNPAFSFLVLISLLITLALQQKQLNISTNELILSRKELEETRMELSRSAIAQEESSKAQLKQAEIQILTTKLSVIEILLNVDGKILMEKNGYGASISEVNIKELTGTFKKDILKELGLIYRDLKKFRTKEE
ncbi:hypothetical protein [Pectobacterium aroidearum]|uniref:hypothetical protein n=1 Tax=Pectobacterium aroidearum TaxID=1201031 RepID=UPI00211398BF|nr:hypothetical protein [Pectobacterium aroidearum]UUE59006.1 hypothetical protein L0Y27_06925 [Pectobacterium aroidearum]UUE71833.1 hypothetical protein L0Y21_07595 [Pectobacterium aroidearum]UUE76233.1 hypothetical protein L0Y20_07700 [Pectobacterium aroidearum]UUE80458.1 hypothetical protein L0Y24_07140 [Pectobacterium aroidearum]